jgi:HEAT repeat protein
LILVLAKTKLAQAEPYLSRIMGGSDPRTRALDVKAYEELGKSAKPERLIRCLTTDPDITVRRAAARAVADLGMVQAIPSLREMVWSKDSRMSRIGLDALIDMRKAECGGPLQKVIKRYPNLDYHRRAVVGLSNLGRLDGPRFYVRLQQMVLDADPSVRVAAMVGLKRHMHIPLPMPTITAHPLPSWLDEKEFTN